MSTTAPQLPMQALIFELDGLFIESESLAGEAIASLFRWNGRDANLNAEAEQRNPGMRLRDLPAIVTSVCGRAPSCDALAREFEELGLRFLQDLLQPTTGATDRVAFATEAVPPLVPVTAGMRRESAALPAAGRQTGAFAVEIAGDDAARAAIRFPASSHSCRGG
jgi:beta-phosphoglucomutase-like phosphatase (HAD superfamily)